MRAKDGAITRVTLDPANPPRGRTDWRRVDALTDEEIEEAAGSDPDALPLSDEELRKLQRVVDVRALRRRLGMSQERFATSFHLSVGTVRDWEQGRSLPDRPARVLLKLIERNPAAVLETLRTPLTSPAMEES
jgi:putative transcriptional regulator